VRVGLERQQQSLKVTDKRVAEKKASELRQRLEREEAGLQLPKSMVEAASKPLALHLDEYLADLRVKGRERSYRQKIENRIKVVCASQEWRQLRDVNSEGFVAWRSKQGGTLRPKTLNDYHAAFCGFMNWLHRHGRMPVNPLIAAGTVDQRGQQAQKRALSDDEATRLLTACDPRRRPAWLLMLTTGLRLGEVRALRWGDLVLDVADSFVRARAATTKNRKEAMLWLTTDVADEFRALRDAMQTRPPEGRQVFRNVSLRNDRFKRDLKAAGIEAVDGRGRKACVHALRHTFITNLHRSGASVREAMGLARHSDARLTMSVYTDEGALPLREVINRLPRYRVGQASPIASHVSDAMGRREAHPVTTAGDDLDPQVLAVSEEGTDCHSLAQERKRVSEGIRTPDPRDHNAVL